MGVDVWKPVLAFLLYGVLLMGLVIGIDLLMGFTLKQSLAKVMILESHVMQLPEIIVFFLMILVWFVELGVAFYRHWKAKKHVGE
jgi:hypothetical protein